MHREREITSGGREFRVVAVQERGVRAQRNQLGEVRTSRVVGPERPLGTRHGHVHVQAARDVSSAGVGELGRDLPIAARTFHRPPGRREGMRPGRRDDHVLPELLAETEDGVGEAQARGDGVPADGRTNLELALAALRVEPIVVGQKAQGALCGRRDLERLAVEEHELLLHSDRRAGAPVEELLEILDRERR
jgi:hypothetical protein